MLSTADARRDQALDDLYGAEKNGRGGLGASSPRVARWLGDIRGYFQRVWGGARLSLRTVRTRMVVFDTAVVDLTDELDHTVDVLFGVQLGGGTDINRALAYCQDQIARPAETILVLINDLYEGGIAEEMLRRASTIVGSGTTMIALLALSDSSHPSFDSDHALPWPESASRPSPARRTCSRI